MAIAGLAHAAVVAGPATVVDGDSLEIAGTRVRLHGIDAPEAQQTCDRNGEAWRCGEEARRQLAEIIGASRVECVGHEKDQYGRLLAQCTAGYTDINRTMVETGWALAFRKYSDAYSAGEARARAMRVGLWGSSFVSPDVFRNGSRDASTAAPDRATPRRAAPRVHETDGLCRIKGNRNRRGQWIYHLPGMPYYDATNPEELFCSEAEAQAAGYRRAIVRP